jgi:hypothetical protein
MAGALLLNQGNPGAVVPVPQEDTIPDLKIAANFERFDGLTLPTDHPATADPDSGGTGPGGAMYGWDKLGAYPRPGAVDEPLGQVYTPGALRGLTNTIGGQPLPVRDWKYQEDGKDGYTAVRSPGIQFRQGVGQRGPSELGAAQTTVLGGITNNPPEPGDLSAIIAGLG